ncbi:MAG: hypothetical protein ACRYFK_07420 [Janthinobacterium lividum]
MKRLVHHLPDLAHEQASLIAQLALHSTFEAADIEYFRRMLAKYPAIDFLAALDQAMAELATEGHLPARPSGPDAASYFLLYDGVGRLAELAAAPASISYLPLAA